MCGQFTLTLDPEELQELLDLGTFVHIVQLLCQTQQANFVLDDFLIFCHLSLLCYLLYLKCQIKSDHLHMKSIEAHLNR